MIKFVVGFIIVLIVATDVPYFGIFKHYTKINNKEAE